MRFFPLSAQIRCAFTHGDDPEQWDEAFSTGQIKSASLCYGLIATVDSSDLYFHRARHFSKVGACVATPDYQCLCPSENHRSQAAIQRQEQIAAKVENQTSRPITMCVQIGQQSPKGNTIESTPSPFFVERNDNGKWGVLLNGPDVGSNSRPVEVDSGKSLEFPFRLNGEGTMRLRLDYWVGSRPDMKCNGSSKNTKHLRSATFTLG